MTEAEYAKKSLKEHEGIVESMKKCDTMEAAMKMHQHIERSLEAVSYTHLDVYKRQEEVVIHTPIQKAAG